MHYKRVWRHGHVEAMKEINADATIDERLRFHGWKVEKRRDYTDECWIYTGRINNNGYGQFSYRGKEVTASRMAYHAWVSPVPDELFVLHRCGVPSCIKPSHLFLGNNRENSEDMMAKGRNAWLHGETVGTHKLKESEVIQIRKRRKAGEILRTMAEEFGVSESCISSVCTGKSWKWLAEGLTEPFKSDSL